MLAVRADAADACGKVNHNNFRFQISDFRFACNVTDKPANGVDVAQVVLAAARDDDFCRAARVQLLHHVRAKKARAAGHNHALVAPEGLAVNPVVGHIVPQVSRFTPHASRFTPHASRFTPHVSRSKFEVRRSPPHYPLPTIHYPLSTIHYPLSHCSTVPLSHCSTALCRPPPAYYPLTTDFSPTACSAW
jgi:hypothetical protein